MQPGSKPRNKTPFCGISSYSITKSLHLPGQEINIIVIYLDLFVPLIFSLCSWYDCHNILGKVSWKIPKYLVLKFEFFDPLSVENPQSRKGPSENWSRFLNWSRLLTWSSVLQMKRIDLRYIIHWFNRPYEAHSILL